MAMINNKKGLAALDAAEEEITPPELKDDYKKLLNICHATVFKENLPYISEAYTVKGIDSDYLNTEPTPTVSYEDKFPQTEHVASFDITKLVMENNDKIIDKLKNVYYLLAGTGDSISLIIRRGHNKCRVSLAVGITENNSEEVIKRTGNIRDALLGNFPGTECSDVTPYSEDGIFSALNKNAYYIRANYSSVGVVSNIATDFSEEFATQGIEKMIDGIIPSDGKEYTLFIVGNSRTSSELEEKKDDLYNLYTALSPFAKRQKNWSTSEGKNWTNSLNASIFASVGAGMLPGGIPIPHVGKLGISPSIGFGHSWGENIGISSGDSVEINQYGVSHMLEIIDKQMKRLEECEALGLWDFAAYVFFTDYDLVDEVSHMYMSLTQGNESYYERPAVNLWNAQNGGGKYKDEIIKIRDYVSYLRHPKFYKDQDKVREFFNGESWPDKVSCTASISGSELTRALNLPGKSVAGLPVIECAPFGREIASYDKMVDGDICIGKIHHMHHDEDIPVKLDSDSLTSHVFITGSTGSGKSNTVYKLLEKANTNFLVIEPAKGEYRYQFGDDVHKYGTNYMMGDMLKINPFAFPENIHVYEHIDRILDVFNVCWPMYAAMPAVLKDSIIRAYEKTGWDMRSSINSRGRVYPTFADVCEEIDNVLDSSDYSDESKGNYKGSLKTRLKSLTNGINGLIFCDDNIPNDILFDSKTIIDLSRVGSSENKALIMGILVIRLQEYRMSSHNGSSLNEGLRHITVLEEAHNLLKNSSSSCSPEMGGGLEAKSVEMLSNAIAEMRTYGEGFVIVDQAPGLLDMSVIRNTNTKIIMRLPDQSDRELVGKAANLNDDQIQELARLQRGVAAVYQNEWIEPVLCHVDKYESRYIAKDNHVQPVTEKSDKGNGLSDTEMRYVNSCIYDPNYLPRESDINFIDCIEKMEIPDDQKQNIVVYARTPIKERKPLYGKVAYDYFRVQGFVDADEDPNEDATQWSDKLVEYLRQNFEFNDDVDFGEFSGARYIFTQMMIAQYIGQLNEFAQENHRIDKVDRLESYMTEFSHRVF